MYAVLILLTLGFFALIAFGWRGVRRGDTPHCQRCDYNLTGNETGQCPECGRPVEQGMVFGERRRRKLPIVVGLVGMLVVGGMGYVQFRDVSILKSMPNSAVSFLARHGSKQALEEAVNRVDMRAIVVDEPLLIWALDELRDRTATAAKIRANLRKLLEYAWGSNTLYGHESDYCDVLVEDASIETEYILDGDVALHATVLVRIPFSAHVFAGMKHFPLQFEDESIRIETDDGRDTKTRGVARFHRFGAWSGDRYHNRFGVPYVFHQGDYDITYTAAVAATLVRPDGVSVDCSHPIELHANVSAVPLDHDNPNSKSIAEFVRREFNITQTKSSFGIGLQNYRSMAFSAKRGIPASIAFEVIAFSGEKETLIGLLCAAKGTATLNFAASTEIVGLEDREFDLQLRFSRDAARECKVPNPWVGEVDLGPFYLEPLPPEFRRSGGQ